MIQVKKTTLFKLYLAACYIFGVGTLHAEVPSKLEPLYAEAVLAYNSADSNRALALINVLQKKIPNSTEILELKALILKPTQPGRSAEVYKDLIRVKTAEKKPAKEIAPYYFELATMKFQNKEFAEAKAFFLKCSQAKFNSSASEFFLGMISFQTNDFSKAEEHFNTIFRDKGLPAEIAKSVIAFGSMTLLRGKFSYWETRL